MPVLTWGLSGAYSTTRAGGTAESRENGVRHSGWVTRPSSQESRDGDDLGFAARVNDTFAFLERDYGFRKVVATPQLVGYQRDPFFVNIIREVGINVLFGRRVRVRDGVRGLWKRVRHEWGVEFPLEYLAADADVEEQLDAARLRVKSRADVDEHVPKLAAFVRAHGARLLSGDEAAYERLAKVGRKRSRDLMHWASKV